MIIAVMFCVPLYGKTLESCENTVGVI